MKDFELKSEQVDALYKHLKPKIDKENQNKRFRNLSLEVVIDYDWDPPHKQEVVITQDAGKSELRSGSNSKRQSKTMRETIGGMRERTEATNCE